MTTIRAVEEEFRIRSLLKVEEKRLPVGPHASLSSIAKTEEGITAPQLRPQLAEPHIMYRVINAHRKTEELAAKEASLLDAEVTKSSVETDRQLDEKKKILEEETLAARSRSTWSTLSHVAQHIAGAGSIAAGVMCGGSPGFFLAASGAIGVGVRVAHDTDLLQTSVKWMSESEEMQKRIAQKIELGAFLLQMGFGLAGGIGSAYITETQQFTSIFASATTALSVAPRVGSAYYDKRLAYIQARMKQIDTQTAVRSWQTHQDVAQFKKGVESIQFQTEELRKAIQALQVQQGG